MGACVAPSPDEPARGWTLRRRSGWRRFLVALVVPLLSTTVACGRRSEGVVAPSGGGPVDADAAVAWVPWSRDAFARARAEGRIVLVNVVASWCHFCHVMDERTYADPRVAALLREHFVAIRVDADARPDVAERYAAWGWPATGILTPTAEPVLELRGYQSPDRFLAILRDLVERKRTGRLRGRVEPPPTAPEDADLARIRQRAVARLDAFYDPDRIGWGRTEQRYPLADAVEHAFWRTELAGDAAWRGRALDTLEATSNLLDPVWGGLYQYSVGGVWTDPHFEKIARIQAGALRTFAWAYALTGQARWIERARRIVDYLRSFLLDPSGGFYTSQDADLRRMDGSTVPGARYYDLDDAGRRALGVPRIDKAMYADNNGEIVHALAVFYAASPTDRDALGLAARATDRLLAEHRDGDGLVRHAADDDGPVRYLRDQAAVGLALVQMFRVTGKARYLDEARRLADAAIDHLWDRGSGAFVANTPDPEAAGVLARPLRPVADNARMARFLLSLDEQLDHGEGSEQPYASVARAALRAVADPRMLAAEGKMIDTYVLAVEHAVREPAWLTVTGDPTDPRTRALHEAALRWFSARIVVERAPPGRWYPDSGAPAAYLCTRTACSPPMRDPAALRAGGTRFLGRTFGPGTGEGALAAGAEGRVPAARADRAR